MDDYQKYVQSKRDSQNTNRDSKYVNIGYGIIIGIIILIVFLMFWYSIGIIWSFIIATPRV